MTDIDNPYRHRRGLTFEQAEGVEPLPAQLKLKELTPALRAQLFGVVHHSLLSTREYDWEVGVAWCGVLQLMHIFRDSRMADEFTPDFDLQVAAIKTVFSQGSYAQVFGWLQWVMEHGAPDSIRREIDFVLENCRAAYRVVDGNLIAPIGSEAELQTLKQAFVDLSASEFNGARAHLRKAAELLTAGHWPDSIRESIHAVESVARVLEPGGEFSKAMAKLERSVKIHGAMSQGFKSLYGYTSDEKGIRHPLLEDGSAKADEADAMFMIGACAAFVSYVINKARAAGLIEAKA